MIATASLLLAGFLLAGWNYWLTNRVQQILNRADRQQDVLDRQFALLPSKSAARTEAPANQPNTPNPWARFVNRITEPDHGPDSFPGVAVAIQGDIDRLLEHGARGKHRQGMK